MPISEYLIWQSQPTTREILDAHLSNIVCILNNVNSKKRIKVEDVMLTLKKSDKKENLSKIIQNELKSRFATVIKE